VWIERKKRQIGFANSLSLDGTCLLVKKFAKKADDILPSEYRSTHGIGGFKVQEIDSARQQNGNDCGVYCCVFKSVVVHAVQNRWKIPNIMAKTKDIFGDHNSKLLRMYLAGAFFTSKTSILGWIDGCFSIIE
jgi:Ulp1 family protease